MASWSSALLKTKCSLPGVTHFMAVLRSLRRQPWRRLMVWALCFWAGFHQLGTGHNMIKTYHVGTNLKFKQELKVRKMASLLHYKLRNGTHLEPPTSRQCCNHCATSCEDAWWFERHNFGLASTGWAVRYQCVSGNLFENVPEHWKIILNSVIGWSLLPTSLPVSCVLQFYQYS
jgi:hypothetical protein